MNNHLKNLMNAEDGNIGAGNPKYFNADHKHGVEQAMAWLKIQDISEETLTTVLNLIRACPESLDALQEILGVCQSAYRAGEDHGKELYDKN